MSTSAALVNPSLGAALTDERALRRAQWVEDVSALVRQASEWAMEGADERRWTVEHEAHEVTEEGLGTYAVPGLRVCAGDDELRLEPVARRVPRADGRVDLYAWPSLYRVLLLRQNGGWTVRTESGLDWPLPWGRETFLTLAEGLLRAE